MRPKSGSVGRCGYLKRACAEVRRFVVEHNLTDQIVFRKIDRSEENIKDLQNLQGSLYLCFYRETTVSL